MNLSGLAAAELKAAYKPERLLALVDDVDLPLGKLRVRASGSAGTHNGLKSIIETLRTQEFARVRIGVGKAPPEWDLADWVLAHYHSEEDLALARETCARAAKAALLVLDEGVEAAQIMFN